MSNIDTATLQREITSLSEKINSKDNEVTALMNVVIETNKGVSDNLVKLTQVVSNVNVLEKAQEAQRKTLNDLSKKVSANETNIKLSLQDKQHIKQSLEEIKTNQKEARGFVSKILGTLMTLAIIGGESELVAWPRACTGPARDFADQSSSVTQCSSLLPTSSCLQRSSSASRSFSPEGERPALKNTASSQRARRAWHTPCKRTHASMQSLAPHKFVPNNARACAQVRAAGQPCGAWRVLLPARRAVRAARAPRTWEHPLPDRSKAPAQFALHRRDPLRRWPRSVGAAGEG